MKKFYILSSIFFFLLSFAGMYVWVFGSMDAVTVSEKLLSKEDLSSFQKMFFLAYLWVTPIGCFIMGGLLLRKAGG
jgi:hypothetical protein